MNNFKIITAITISLFYLSCNHNASKNIESELPKNWETLNELEYTIQYPDSFELDKSNQMGESIVLLSKLSSPSDLFRENVNLTIQDLSDLNIDLNKFVQISESQINLAITDAKILESSRSKAYQGEYHEVIFTGTQGKFNLKFQQHYWIHDETAYVLTFTCESNQFSKYQFVGESILKSFTIK